MMMAGRKKVEREVVMETDLVVDPSYSYSCEVTDDGKLIVVRHKRQKYEVKKKEEEKSGSVASVKDEKKEEKKEEVKEEKKEEKPPSEPPVGGAKDPA